VGASSGASGAEVEPEPAGEVVHGAARQGEAAAQLGGERPLAARAQGAKVVGEARGQVGDDLAEDAQVGEPLLVGEEEPGPLGEGGPAADLAPPLVAHRLRLGPGAEARQGRVPGGGSQPGRGCGAGADSTGGAQRVEQERALVPLEGAGEAVRVEERVEVGLVRGRAVGAPPTLPQGRDEQRAPWPVTAH